MVDTGCIEACGNICGADPKCVAAMYAYENGYCYLKSTLNTPPVEYKSVNAIIFYNASSAASSTTAASAPYCTSSAPPSPWLINGGFEEGLTDYSNGNASGGYGMTGTFSSQVTMGNVFEGCKALQVTCYLILIQADCSRSVYPTSNQGSPRRISFGIQYGELQPSTNYSVTFIIGRPISYLTSTTDTAPYLNVYIQGYKVYQGKICGWSDSGSCSTAATNGGRGSVVSSRFQTIATEDYYDSVWFEIGWTANPNDAILLDDIRINPFSGTIASSTTTLAMSSTSR